MAGSPAGGDRLAVAAGTRALLAVAAEERGVLVAVDDLHWADRPSVEAVVFAARRLAAVGIVVVGTARQDGDWTRQAAAAGLPVLTVTPLSAVASAAVLAASEQRSIHADVAEQLLDACAGNPLALTEITRHLTDAQLAGAEPVDRALRASPSIERAFRRRLEALPHPARAAATIAAAEPSGSLRVITAAPKSASSRAPPGSGRRARAADPAVLAPPPR